MLENSFGLTCNLFYTEQAARLLRFLSAWSLP